MRLKLYVLILACSIMLTTVSTTSEHPIKLTASEIKYDIKTNSIKIQCKVFVDDFAPAINPDLEDNINNLTVSDNEKQLIEDYFATKYKISINDKKLPLKFKSYKVEYNAMTVEFLETNITLKKGDTIHIENQLLFEEFGPMQSNWMAIRIPPFLPNYNFESKIEDYTYSHIF